MGLSVTKLLNDYFSVDDLKDVLNDIGEPVSGTKDQLVKRVRTNWKSHNRDNYELLEFLDEDSLYMICHYYNIDTTSTSVPGLRNSIKKYGVLNSNSFGKIKKKKNNNIQTDFLEDKPFRDVHINIGHIKISKNNKIGIVIGIATAIITLIGIIITI